MDDARRVRVSKYLAKHLRHAPEAIGLTLAPGGWVDVTELLAAARAHGFPIRHDELLECVATNDKRRFALDETGLRLRASQGHSVAVDLGLEEVEPPEVLFHGTVERSWESIRVRGLIRGSRHHVHLSGDRETARRVGARRGEPIVLAVAAGRMHRDGHRFWRSANGVWLTDHVPPSYLGRE